MGEYKVTLTLWMDSDAPESDEDLKEVKEFVQDSLDATCISAYDIDVKYKEGN